MIRIIHTSDLHLDAEVFENDRKRAELRKKEQRALFANIMMYARDRKADLLLFAGDLFDKPVPEEETRALILREFENTPDTEIVIACGRHDAYRPGSFLAAGSFPSNVHIFDSAQLQRIDLPRLKTHIYGYSFTRRSMERSRLSVVPMLDKSMFNVFVGHTTLGGDARFAPVTAEQIARSGFDYVALGGDHTPTELLEAEGVRYAMSGSPEGVDFDDCGARFVRIVAMDKPQGALVLQSKQIGLSHHRFEKLEISMDGGKTCADAAEAALAFIKEKDLDGGCFLRLTLTGRVPYTFRPDEASFDRVRMRVDRLELIDNTVLICPEGAQTGKKEDFLSVFASKAAEKTSDEQLRSEILKAARAALEGSAGEKEKT